LADPELERPSRQPRLNEQRANRAVGPKVAHCRLPALPRAARTNGPPALIAGSVAVHRARPLTLQYTENLEQLVLYQISGCCERPVIPVRCREI
jgi:hypothetical protein